MVWPVNRPPEVIAYGRVLTGPAVGPILVEAEIPFDGVWFFLVHLFSQDTNIFTINLYTPGNFLADSVRVRHIDAVRTTQTPLFRSFQAGGFVRAFNLQSGGAGAEYQAIAWGVRI